MKALKPLLVFFAVALFVACGSDGKEKNDPYKKQKSTAAYQLKEATNAVNWTAYKTTEKIPVKGKFTKVNITAGGEGNSIEEAINNTEFSIPISSIFTSDSSRDYKIRKFFFGVMENTKLLSGSLVIENDSVGYANITMNGITKKLPFDYTIEGKAFAMQTKMDVLNWNAQNSIDSLNAICRDLHKGLDGVSKTWAEVAIDIKSTFK